MYRKILLLGAAMMALSLNAAAQAPSQTQPDKPQTKIETFQARTGTVLIKNYSTIGTVSGLGGSVTVTSFEFVDPQSAKREYGIGVEATESGRLERSARSYVDYDEIDSLLKGIDYVSKIDVTQTKLSNFEAHYRTKGGSRYIRF